MGTRSFPNALGMAASSERRLSDTRNHRLAAFQSTQIPEGNLTLEAARAQLPPPLAV